MGCAGYRKGLQFEIQFERAPTDCAPEARIGVPVLQAVVQITQGVVDAHETGDPSMHHKQLWIDLIGK